MKKLFFIGALLFSSLCLAQEPISKTNSTALDTTIQTEEKENQEASSGLTFEEEKIIPMITAESSVRLGEELFLNASASKLVAPSHGAANYSWDFGDGSPIKWGEMISHTYGSPGIYTAKLKVSQGTFSASFLQDIFVYSRQGVLISDSTLDIDEIVQQAGEQGLLLKNIIHPVESGLSTEEEFIRKLQENLIEFKGAEIVIFYTQSPTAFQSFGQLWQKLADENKFDPKEKTWVQIMEEGSLPNATKLLRPVFSIIDPDFIFLARPDSLNILFENTDSADAIALTKLRKLEHILIDQRRANSPLLMLSNLMSYFATKGVSQNVIYLLLAVPFLTFSIAFFRQFIGISTYGVYTPLMLSLSFLILGLQFGLIVFLSVMLVSFLLRMVFEKIDMLYIPKVALLFSLLAVSFFLVLGLGLYFNSSINLTLIIFPMLMMVSLSEKFVSTQSSSGFKYAFLSTGETILVSLVGYLLVTWEWIQSSILALPELILIPMIGIFWLGKFTGLRLSEYFKFRNLFQEESQEE